ncbi:hypothetical protein ILUMI_04445 [Ignelater luminosus]|uniref:snRNP core protein D2 n=1 Tax=Ignelater luminosus TaxID=2038154 RepID=A0A8K0D952_IGNLU|nr:hypothetical protein ILUMI_04445 [Ignelater luminosus]
MLSSTDPQSRVFTTQMQEILNDVEVNMGPLSVLANAVRNNNKVLVHIQGNRKFLGQVETFDRHFNMILEDVIEMWTVKTRSKKRINKSRFISKLLIRGDSVILVARNPPTSNYQHLAELKNKPDSLVEDSWDESAFNTNMLFLVKESMKHKVKVRINCRNGRKLFGHVREFDRNLNLTLERVLEFYTEEPQFNNKNCYFERMYVGAKEIISLMPASMAVSNKTEIKRQPEPSIEKHWDELVFKTEMFSSLIKAVELNQYVQIGCYNGKRKLFAQVKAFDTNLNLTLTDVLEVYTDNPEFANKHRYFPETFLSSKGITLLALVPIVDEYLYACV